MVGNSASTTRLAGIRPAPLCREDSRRSNKMAASASSLPSLARLGMFKHANEAKSRFIHQHMRAATAALASEMGSADGRYPRQQWSRPCGSPGVVSEPLAVMTTETGLEDYRRRKKADSRAAPGVNARWRIRCERHVPLLGEERFRRARLRANRRDFRHDRNPEDRGGDEPGEPLPRRRARCSTRGGGDVTEKTRALLAPPRYNNDNNNDNNNNSKARGNKQQQTPLEERHANNIGNKRQHEGVVKLLPQGVSVLVGADGVRRSRFPRGCEYSGWMDYNGGSRGVDGGDVWGTGSGSVGTGGGLSKWEEGVVTRLCDPKSYTGTAATGHLPSTVDLEGGSEVLLKDAPITVKDHVGAQEVSWRLRLAERL